MPNEIENSIDAQMDQGLVEPGNIDLLNRPKVKNADGSISTVRSIGVNVDNQEVLLPTVTDDGRIVEPKEAVQIYRKTGRHLGKFKTPEDSTAYAKTLHEQQAKLYMPQFADGGSVESSIDAQMQSASMPAQDAAREPMQSPGPVPAPEPMAAIDPIAQQIDLQMREEKYGTLGQQAIAGAEGFAKGIAGPLATGAERMLGVPPEDIAGRAEVNPMTHYGTEILGLVAPAVASLGATTAARAGLATPELANTVRTLGEFTQAGLLGKAGTAAAKKAGFTAATEAAAQVGSTAGRMAVQFGTENALLSIGDELSKAIVDNPDTIQTAAINVGLSGLIGAAAGGGLGKASDLWKAKVGPESEGFLKDFRSRLHDHAKGNIPAADAVIPELQKEYSAASEAVNDLRGNTGLKAEDIRKILPETATQAMRDQAGDVLIAADQALKKAAAEPGIYQGTRLQAITDYGHRLAGAAANPNASAAELFTAIDDFKKGIGPLKDWKFPSPETEKPAHKLIGDIYEAAKNSLEDTSVWGQAGKRQAEINRAFAEYIPAAKEFERVFADKVGGEVQISPQKVNTLINQLGKPNAEIKLDKLANYIKANDRLYTQLEKIHANLGVENPYHRPSLTAVRAILDDITPGMRAADYLHKNALNLAAEGSADILGATMGHATGVPGGGVLGGYFGHYAIKPLMKSIMPVMIKPLMKLSSSALGMRAGMEALDAVVKGESLALNATKALFTSAREVIPQSLVASHKEIEKLDEKIQELAQNPAAMMDIGGEASHYLPDQSIALSKTAANAVNYLTTQRPKPKKLGPLDKPIEPTKSEKRDYERTLRIAQQPLMVLQHVKDGTVVAKDIQDLQVMYPAAYAQLKNKVLSAMTDHLAEGGTVPYRLRMGLSLFVAEPLDSSLTPQSIQAAQATFLQPDASPQQASKPPGGKNKLASITETPLQARAASKTAE